MDNTKKILLVVFVAVSMLVWFVANSFLNNLFAYFQLLERYSWLHAIINISSIVAGILAMIALYRVKIVYNYTFDVVSEIKKVTWPNKKETWSATLVVIIAVLIAGLVLGIFDWISASLLGLILS